MLTDRQVSGHPENTANSMAADICNICSQSFHDMLREEYFNYVVDLYNHSLTYIEI